MMRWKSINREKPENFKKIWISYYMNGIYSQQYQTYAKLVGKDPNGEYMWHDFVIKEIMVSSKYTITHWMDTPDNPIF